MAKGKDTYDDLDDEPGQEKEPSKLDEFRENLKAQAEAQGSDEGQQEVPEKRPQGFTGPGAGTRSQTDLNTPKGEAHGEAEYKAAEPTEANEKRAAESGRIPHLIEGQTVQVIEGQYKGRMASVMAVDYKDEIQAMRAHMGGSESRFAEVEDYVLRTRDGRSEVLVVKPEEVAQLDPNNGWGRGTI